MTTDRPERFYWLWQEAMAHALLLGQQPERSYPQHGDLTGLQLAEGARATARFFAFALAEAPARETEHFEAKIMVYEAMVFDEDEFRRSRTHPLDGRGRDAAGCTRTRYQPDQGAGDARYREPALRT